MFNRPYDLAVMIGLFALALITISLGVASVMDLGVEMDNKVSFINDTRSTVGRLETVGGASTGGLSGEEGTNPEETTEDNILKEGFQTLLGLGEVYAETKKSMNKGSSLLGIDPAYWTVGAALIIIIFATVVYTWLRGR